MLLPDGVECVFNVGPSEVIALPLGVAGKTKCPQITAFKKLFYIFFSFTIDYQFTSRTQMENEAIDVVKKARYWW